MSGLFPLRRSVDLDEDRKPRLVELDDEVADEVFDALSSRTTREILSELHASPQTASDLAGVTDTSVQNAQYHLKKLVAADLVEVVDTWYSERGTEMKVYAPSDEALVLFAGQDAERSLRGLLKRIVGVIGLLLPVSAVAAWLADSFSATGTPTYSVQGGGESGGSGGDAGAMAPAESGDGGGDASADGMELQGEPPASTPEPEATAVADGGSTDMRGGEDGATTPTPESGSLTEQAATATPEDAGVEMTGDSVAGNISGTEREGVDPTATPLPDQETLEVTVDAVGGTDPAVLAGVAFFLGGAFVLAVVAVTWYWRS